MTLVIAAEGENFVIIGADTKNVINYPGGIRAESNMEDKLIQVANHVCITIAGVGDIGTQFIEKFKATLKSREDGATYIAEKFSSFCKKEFFTKIADTIKDSYSPLFLISGLDKIGNKYKKPIIFIEDSSDAFYPGRWKKYAFIGVDIIANYLFSKHYRKSAGQNKLPNLIAQTIYDTSKCDGNVGCDMKIFIIDQNGVREISKADILKLYRTWEQEELESLVTE